MATSHSTAAASPSADDLQELCRQQREDNAQSGRSSDTDQDDLRALIGGEAGGSETDDDRVVARQHQVDHDDLGQRRQHFGSDKIKQSQTPH